MIFWHFITLQIIGRGNRCLEVSCFLDTRKNNNGSSQVLNQLSLIRIGHHSPQLINIVILNDHQLALDMLKHCITLISLIWYVLICCQTMPQTYRTTDAAGKCKADSVSLAANTKQANKLGWSSNTSMLSHWAPTQSLMQFHTHINAHQVG